MALLLIPSIMVAGTRIKCIFGGVVRYRMNMSADNRVIGVTQWRPGLCVSIVKTRIVSKGIRGLHRLSLVGGVGNINRNRSAKDIAVVTPYEHFFPLDIPRVNTVE